MLTGYKKHFPGICLMQDNDMSICSLAGQTYHIFQNLNIIILFNEQTSPYNLNIEKIIVILKFSLLDKFLISGQWETHVTLMVKCYTISSWKKLEFFDFHACTGHAWNNSFFKLGFTPCKTEQPLRGMELQEKEAQ